MTLYNKETLLHALKAGEFSAQFQKLYGADQIAVQTDRYIDAVEQFTKLFGKQQNLRLFSAPGRTEIGGNHTDHNHGCVLAGSVNLDVIAVVSATETPTIRIQSQGYPMDTVALDSLEVRKEEENTSVSLIRGMASRFQQDGLNVGGFDAYTTSNVLKGSGLSSSAAFEVLTGTILNHIYNDGGVSPVAIAQFSQYAENVYFGKPSGLMDQMASSVGGIISIDFEDTVKPVINQVDFDFAASGYHLCIVDTGGNHADLTGEYASITTEMKHVAGMFGQSYLRGVSYKQLVQKLPQIREECGDRAALRALHFVCENERVGKQVAALAAGDFDSFKSLIIESGHSSFEYLQNVYTNLDVTFQGLSLALCLAQQILQGCGAWRVHGGGFGGTTQNFVPDSKLSQFTETMEHVFGAGHCHVLSIRPIGGTEITATAH